MKYIKLYDKFTKIISDDINLKLYEKTKIDKWYDENPNEIKSFDIPTLKSMDMDEKRIFRNLNDVSSNEKEIING